MKKKAVIVFGITKDYAFALANVLIGMKKHCNNFWDDIIVYHDGLSDEDMRNLSYIFPCKFIVFDTSRFSPDINKNSLNSYSYLTMARFECFDMLKEYQYVIWHDVDILIQGDFEPLLKCADNCGFALTGDNRFFVETNFYSLISGYNLLKPLYNAGLMVLKDTLIKHEELSEYCYSKFNQYADKIRYLDQAVLNMMIQDYGISVGYIKLAEYCCHPSNPDYRNAAIIHAYGKDKFWSSQGLKIQFPEWVSNNREWLSIVNRDKEEKKEIVFCDKEPVNPKVSVVMSIYERSDFMNDSIKSILQQTYDNYEFLIVLEKSDSQQKIKEQIEETFKDKRIRIICNETKLGFAASLNVGLDAAKGEYIARMDDDDISMPERFAKEVEFLDSHQDITIVGTYMKMFMNSNEECTVPLDEEELLVRSLTETPLYHPTVMMRKEEMFKQGLKYDENCLTEDYELWCRAMHCVKIANIPEILLYYRASGQNATVTKAEQVLNSHVRIVQRNFKEYLDLELSYDEVVLLERPEILYNCFNSTKLSIVRQEAVDKIMKANKKNKVFNQDYLEKRFVKYKLGFTMRMTIFLQRWPGVLKFAKICYGIISKNGEYSYLFHKKVEKGN